MFSILKLTCFRSWCLIFRGRRRDSAFGGTNIHTSNFKNFGKRNRGYAFRTLSVRFFTPLTRKILKNAYTIQQNRHTYINFDFQIPLKAEPRWRPLIFILVFPSFLVGLLVFLLTFINFFACLFILCGLFLFFGLMQFIIWCFIWTVIRAFSMFRFFLFLFIIFLFILCLGFWIRRVCTVSYFISCLKTCFNFSFYC